MSGCSRVTIQARGGAVDVPVVARHGAYAVCPLPGRPHHWCIARTNGNVVLRSPSLAGLLAALPLLADGQPLARWCAVVWAHERTERHGLSKRRRAVQDAARQGILTGRTADALLIPAPLNPYQTDLEATP